MTIVWVAARSNCRALMCLAMETSVTDLKQLIRSIPDYPKSGIIFRDITTLLAHADGLRACITQMTEPFQGIGVEAVAGIEARGFIVGGAMADKLGTGFVPIRKKGKLPAAVVGEEYALEYGSDRIEMHADAITPGEKVLLVDDLIATGGTAEAAIKLIRGLGGEVVGAAFIIDLPDLGGLRRIQAMGVTTHVLVEFEGH